MIPRIKYWCNIPVSFPWYSTGQFRDLRIWLLDNVPNHDDYEFGVVDRPFFETRIIYFAREEDAAMFALRWA